MKILINIDLNLENFSKEEKRQIIFDNLINYACTSHQRDALKWIAEVEKRKATKSDLTSCQEIVDCHKNWSEIMTNVDFEIIEENS